MKKILAIAVLIVVAAGLFGADMGTPTGQWLLENWHLYQKYLAGARMTVEELAGSALYMGYVLGASDMLRTIGFLSIPDEVRNAQIFAIVGKYLDDHPEHWNLLSTSIISRALNAIYTRREAP